MRHLIAFATTLLLANPAVAEDSSVRGKADAAVKAAFATAGDRDRPLPERRGVYR